MFWWTGVHRNRCCNSMLTPPTFLGVSYRLRHSVLCSLRPMIAVVLTIVERLSASDLCSDGWVVRMWVRILAATMVLVSFSKTLYRNCFSKWVPVRAELVVVFDSPYTRRNGSNWAVYSLGSWNGFRNDFMSLMSRGNNIKRRDTSCKSAIKMPSLLPPLLPRPYISSSL